LHGGFPLQTNPNFSNDIPLVRRAELKHSATASLMRKLNRSAVLDLIRQDGPLARSEIARRLEISLPTVMRNVDDLLAEGLVRWTGGSEVNGGRPRSLLEFNGDGHAVVSLDLGGTKMYGTVTTLSGKVQQEATIRTCTGEPEKCLEQVYKLIEDLLCRPLFPGQVMRGIGVGVPSTTLTDDGVVAWAPSLGWRDVPLKEILTQRFGLPVITENDVNLAALGEYGFGAAKGASSVVCIAIGTGIGGGILIDGKIYRGFTRSAGEVGHVLPSASYLGQRYDVYGAMEIVASGIGIAQEACKLLEKQGQPFSPPGPSAEAVFNAARAGEDWARQVVDQTIDHLSLAVGAVSAILDPEVIVLGGGVARSADLLIGPVLQRLEGVNPGRPNLVPSKLGSQATVLGAILLVQDIITEHISF